MPAAFGKGQAVVSEEAMQEKHANRTGDVSGLELTSRGKPSNGNLIWPWALGMFHFFLHTSHLTD